MPSASLCEEMGFEGLETNKRELGMFMLLFISKSLVMQHTHSYMHAHTYTHTHMLMHTH